MRRRSLIAFAVTAAVALAGLPSPAAQAKRTPPLRFSRPVQVEAVDPVGSAQGNGERQPSGEPSIELDAKGVVYISGVDSLGKASPVWVSQDRGRSFAVLATPAQFRERSPLGAEGDIAIGRDDSVYFVDMGFVILALTKWAAPANGASPTWQFTEPQAIGTLAGYDDRPWLAYGADQSGESLWAYANHDALIAVYRSTDGGLTWSRVTQSMQGAGYFPGMIAAPRTSSKDLYLFGQCDTATSLCARSTHDGGASWTDVHVADTEPGTRIAQFMVADAVDAAGTVYGTWAEDTDPSASGGAAVHGCHIYYAASRDGGRTWGRKVRVDDGRGCAVFPWITAGDRGRIALAWYQTPAPGDTADDVPDDASWYVNASVIVGADTAHPRVTRGRADPKPVHRGPLLRELWDYLQIAIGPDGRVHIAYAEDVTAGPDGPAGTGLAPQGEVPVAEEMHPKDTMYVQQTSGPRLRV